jgi:Tol biopolymer transport system component
MNRRLALLSFGVALVSRGSASSQETTERVSVDSSGAEANDDSSFPVPSADGRVIAFSSRASNLVAGDTNGTDDLFAHDRTTGVTERVSIDSTGAEGNGPSSDAAISADGQIVAFTSAASNLVLVVDAGASKGVSFTPGLELVLGR